MSTKFSPTPAYLGLKTGKFLKPDMLKVAVVTLISDHDISYSSYRSTRASPANDSPDTPSPIPDPACQLAAEAKELVDGVCSLCTEDHSKSEMCTRSLTVLGV